VSIRRDAREENGSRVVEKENNFNGILLLGRRESYQKTEFDGEDLKIQEPCFFPKKQGSCR